VTACCQSYDTINSFVTFRLLLFSFLLWSYESVFRGIDKRVFVDNLNNYVFDQRGCSVYVLCAVDLISLNI